MKTFDKITEAQIKSRGVQALADRPNQTGQYGEAGLTAAQVKLHFDKLAMYLAEKLNFLFEELGGESAAEYIRLSIDEYEDLSALVSAIGSGDFATRLLKVYPNGSHTAQELAPLQTVLDLMARGISERVVQATGEADVRRAYIVEKDGSQGVLPISDAAKASPGAIPVYDERGGLAASNLVESIRVSLDTESRTLHVQLLSIDGQELCCAEASFEDLFRVYDKDGNNVVDKTDETASPMIRSIGLTSDHRLRIVFADGSFVESAEVISGVDSSAPGTVASAASSSLTALTWDEHSSSDNSYHFKAFRYLADQNNLDVDFDVRLLVGGTGFRYPCNLKRPFGDASRIIFRTPRIIFEDEAQKNAVAYFRAYEKPSYVKGALCVSIEAVNGELYYGDLKDEHYFIENSLFKTVDKGSWFAPNGTTFMGTDGREYVIKDWSIEATDGQGIPETLTVNFYRAVENDLERELWLEVETSSDAVSEAHLNVRINGGDASDIELVKKDWEPYIGMNGFDSLTIFSADWANKTTNLNISSRATAPYSTASGNDSRAEGEAGDVGGIGNKGSGRADLVRGEGNINTGDDVIQSGKGNYNTAGQSLQQGNNNYNEGYSTAQIGNGLKNYGGNAAQFGHTNENHSLHTLQTGYMNTIPKGCDYASTVGTRLTAARRLQALYGQCNEEDTRALSIWANGNLSAGKNVFAIPENGVPIKEYDGITLGNLSDCEEVKNRIKALFINAAEVAL